MLTDLKEMGEGEKTKEQEIITAQTALENLYLKIKFMEIRMLKKQIGYATLTASTSNNQVLAPTWI